MELALIILCGILFGAFNVGFFCLGYYVRSLKQEEDGVALTKNNLDYFKDATNFVNYDGRS